MATPENQTLWLGGLPVPVQYGGSVNLGEQNRWLGGMPSPVQLGVASVSCTVSVSLLGASAMPTTPVVRCAARTVVSQPIGAASSSPSAATEASAVVQVLTQQAQPLPRTPMLHGAATVSPAVAGVNASTATADIHGDASTAPATTGAEASAHDPVAHADSRVAVDAQSLVSNLEDFLFPEAGQDVVVAAQVLRSYVRLKPQRSVVAVDNGRRTYYYPGYDLGMGFVVMGGTRAVSLRFIRDRYIYSDVKRKRTDIKIRLVGLGLQEAAKPHVEMSGITRVPRAVRRITDGKVVVAQEQA